MPLIQRRGAVVVWAAVLLFALVPAVDALCALDGLGVGHSETEILLLAAAARDGGAPHDGDPCCAAVSAPVIESSKPFGVSLAGSMQPVGPFVPAARETAVQAFFAAHLLARLPTPPPEPVSRRFPRLLI